MAEDFFNDLGKKITKAANEAVDKGTEFFEVTKIRAQIAGEGKAIEKAYRDMGEIVYRLQQEGTPVTEEVAKLCDDIQSHEACIKSLRSDMANFKGMKVCPNCEEMVDKSAAFCPKCGSSVTAEETVEEEDIVETADDTAEEADSEAKDTAEEVISEVKDAVKEAASQAKDVAEEVIEKAKEAVPEAKEAAGKIMEEIKE
ncbi:MAG: zinc ribbon domain-containing protein [Lachnospiraceae bacterium]|nr:zinc ribbon domain-containing protein [Lachnospiraceae bacterium]